MPSDRRTDVIAYTDTRGNNEPVACEKRIYDVWKCSKRFPPVGGFCAEDDLARLHAGNYPRSNVHPPASLGADVDANVTWRCITRSSSRFQVVGRREKLARRFPALARLASRPRRRTDLAVMAAIARCYCCCCCCCWNPSRIINIVCLYWPLQFTCSLASTLDRSDERTAGPVWWGVQLSRGARCRSSFTDSVPSDDVQTSSSHTIFTD